LRIERLDLISFSNASFSISFSSRNRFRILSPFQVIVEDLPAGRKDKEILDRAERFFYPHTEEGQVPVGGNANQGGNKRWRRLI
jgi:hypothetical protein